MTKMKTMSVTPKSSGGNDATFVEKISVGLQSQDIIQMTDVYLDLGLTATTLQQQVEQYNDDIGAFLEANSIIPEGTGEIFNLLQIGKSKKDALTIYGKNNSIDAGGMKTIYEALSSDGLLAAIEATSGAIPDPEPAESEVSVNMTTTGHIKDSYSAAGIVFSGTVVAEDPVTISVTPVGCKFKGLTSDAETEHSDAWTSSAFTSLETLNAEFASVQVCPTADSDVKLTISIDGEPNDFLFQVVQASKIDSINFENTVSLDRDAWTAINPITFSGTLYESDPVTVTVEPTNCKLKGFASDSSTEYSSTYSFEGSELDTLDTEFASVQVFASVASDASIKVNWAGAYHHSNDTIYEFDIESTSAVTSSLDPSTQLKRDSFVTINPITFSGTLYKEDPISLTITPTNCSFKNAGLNTEIEYNSEYTSTEDNLETLNSKFEELQVKATASSGVKLNIAIDGSGSDYSFNSVLTESALTCSTNTTIQLQEHEWVDIDPIVFSGTLYTEDPVTVTVTPTNCKIKNFATEPETEHSTTHTFNNVTDLSTLNAEFLNLQVQATAESDTKIVVAVDGTETEFVFGATAAVSDVSVQTLNINTALTVDQYADVPIVFAGTIYSDDAVTVTVTPTNCKMKGFVNDAETEHDTQYQFVADGLTKLNAEFANMQICATDISGVKLAVAIDGASTDYNFANVTAVSNVTASLDTTTQLQQDVYKEIEPILFSGKIYESDPVTVIVTPTNCKFKGLASGATTEHSSAYTFSSKTTLEQLNTEFANLQVCASSITGVKLTVTIDDAPTEFSFGNVIAISNATVASLENTKQLNLETYTAVPITFSGTIYPSDPVTVIVTPTNCKFKNVATEAETEHSSAYTFEATSLSALNAEFADMTVLATAMSDVKLAVSIDGSSTDYTFANITGSSLAFSEWTGNTAQVTSTGFTTVTGISATGKLFGADPFNVVITPTNCKFKIGEGAEQSAAYTISNCTDISALNNQLKTIAVQATAATGISLALSVADHSEITAKTYTNFSLKPSAVTTDSLSWTLSGNLGQYSTQPALVFSGTIEPLDPVSVVITPTDCVLKGFATEAGTEHDTAYTFQATSLSALNAEFATVQIKPNHMTTAKVAISIDSGTAKEFTMTVEGSSNVTVSCAGTGTALTIGTYGTVGALTFAGDAYAYDPVSVTVTPTNCTFKGCVSGADTEHSTAYAFNDQTSVGALNTEFASLQVNCSATGAKLTVGIVSAEGTKSTNTDITFTNVTAAPEPEPEPEPTA